VVGDTENPEANEADGETEAGATENPEVENLAQSNSGSNSVSVTCVPYEIDPDIYNIPIPIPGGSNLELTQLGVFNCPQVESYDCTRCELFEDAYYLGLAISLECTSSDDSVYFPVGNGTFIRQIGMSCTNNNL